MKHEITRADILSPEAFEKVRKERRSDLIAKKRLRRIEVGPYAMFYFENYDTMWWQIHEMLRIEKGGEEQIADELQAYSPLVPNGRELVATMMLEIDDSVRRDRVLRELGGVERAISIRIGETAVQAVPEEDVERTKADGKTSSVHFMRFPFDEAAVAAFRKGGAPVLLAIDHAHYGHIAVIAPAVREALAADFD
ncbi:MAG: DUF3501 family protein [Sneathiellaceae bacterium]